MSISALKKQVELIYDQIKEIQDECSHPTAAMVIVNKSNTGNYDPSEDCYWTEFHCTLCDKKWSEDQ